MNISAFLNQVKMLLYSTVSKKSYNLFIIYYKILKNEYNFIQMKYYMKRSLHK